MTHRRALTLVEILVVAAIIAALSAILLPVFARAKEAGQKAESISNLRQIAAALIVYAQDRDGRMAMSHYNRFGWLGEIGLVSGGRAMLRDPRYVPALPGWFPAAPGYGVNSCLQSQYRPPTVDSLPANVSLVGTSADFRRVDSDPHFVPGLSLGMPDGAFADRARRIAGREVIVTNGVWGSRRYHGGGLYAFADGHAKWLHESKFRIVLDGPPCRGKPDNQFSAPSGAPTFELVAP